MTRIYVDITAVNRFTVVMMSFENAKMTQTNLRLQAEEHVQKLARELYSTIYLKHKWQG